MAAAIFGLIGVVIGGVLNGLVSAWLADRALRSDRQVGTRLVRSELVFFLGAAKRAASTPLEDLPTLHQATTELWQDNRSLLAKSLDETQWVHIAQAYAYIDSLLALLVFRPDGKLEQWRIDEGTRCCNDMINPIKEALRALVGSDEDQSTEYYKYHRGPTPPDDEDEMIRKLGGLPPDQIPR